MIDLVLSHTSDQHRWFRESRSSRDNPKANWYVWADAKPDGTPPNNWLSIFGGPAWEWDSERLQYYQHNFLKEQPDLNFHEPEVQDELLEVARFWLERGVDGFRLDTINFYFCDGELRDNPVLPPELRDYSTAPAVNPYNWQEHLYDKSRPEMIGFLRAVPGGDGRVRRHRGGGRGGRRPARHGDHGGVHPRRRPDADVLRLRVPVAGRAERAAGRAGAAAVRAGGRRTAGPAGRSPTTTWSGTPRAGRWMRRSSGSTSR